MTHRRWLIIRAAGTILGPFALWTAFMAFAPRALGAYPMTILCLSIAVGLLASWPKRITVAAAALRVVYAYAVLTALTWWTLFAAAWWFPEAWRALQITL